VRSTDLIFHHKIKCGNPTFEYTDLYIYADVRERYCFKVSSPAL
jgi:hypothetical protein